MSTLVKVANHPHTVYVENLNRADLGAAQTRNVSREALNRIAIFLHRPGGRPGKWTCNQLTRRIISD